VGAVNRVPDPAVLTAGYAHRRMGTASYYGVLRAPGKREPVWACTDEHMSPARAGQCAQAELDRRIQAAGVVITLLNCKVCERWYENARGITACPQCDVPLERVKLAVVSREPA
jgi:hypothetical protein